MVESSDLICNLVYDYYETRIGLGSYKYGDTLPPIPKIAEAFRMAPRTVRAALARLEKNGYIRISPRRPAEGIYRADPDQIGKNAALYFVPRKEGILDICQAGKLLIEPVWEFAQSSLDEEVWVQLRENMSLVGKVNLSVPIRMHIHAFSALKNKLILNFYWDLLRYIRFPYLADGGEERDEVILNNEIKSGIGLMRKEPEGDFGSGLNQLLAFCSQAEEVYDLKGCAVVPFNWNVYWPRPQLCYTMVSRIISEIIRGTYPVGGSLPSMPVLSQQLGISYRTLRRTLSILDSLGVIRLHQGKVSEVCEDIERIEFGRPEIKEGFRLYRDSLQFMAATVRPVFLYTLQNVKKEECSCLVQEFMQLLNQNTCHRCLKVTMDFIVDRCPSLVVRECYRVLAGFLVWGYPMMLYRVRKRQLQEEYARRVRALAAYLYKEDWEGFAGSWKGLMECEQRRAEQFLGEYCGVT